MNLKEKLVKAGIKVSVSEAGIETSLKSVDEATKLLNELKQSLKETAKIVDKIETSLGKV